MTDLALPPTEDADDLRWIMGLSLEEMELVLAELPPAEQVRLAEQIEQLAPPPPPWEPLPYQVPPEGKWFGWMMMMGRNTGKSATITRYMDDHANGPPCFHGPIPHRMGIIAATHGDASASIVGGKDGLTVINPDIRRGSMDGYSIVKWPNGSFSYIFGTNTMDAVERLRARTNRSLLVGTMIETENGPRLIETIKPGERVWTERGLRPVMASTGHGMRPIWRMRTRAGRDLSLTPDHELWVIGQGWTRVDRIAVGGRLTAWNGTVTAGIHEARIGRARSDSSEMTVRRARPRNSFIERSTRNTMGRSPTDSTSTTSTRTRATTTRPTWKPYRRKDMRRSILRATSGMSLVARQPGRFRGRLRDVQAEWVERCDQPSSFDPLASNAAIRLGEHTLDSAPSGAGAATSGIMLPPEGCGHALCAEAISIAGPTAPPLLADDVVEMIWPGSVVGPVWDLTVAGAHDFFANGILAHNCLDVREEIATWRYLKDALAHANLSLRGGPHPHWVGATTPKPRPSIRALMENPIVVVTRAKTSDNTKAPPEITQQFYDEFGNSRLGVQELEGEILEDVTGALWTQELIDQWRVTADEVPKLRKVRIYVDPSWGTTNDECGIIVCGLGVNGHVYVLADLSKRLTSDEWGMMAALGRLPRKIKIDGHLAWDPSDFGRKEFFGRVAEYVVAEKNFQGDQVRTTMKLVSATINRRVPFRLVNASVGKRLRAEPAHLLCEQGKVHIVGSMVGLEFQLTSWIPPEAGEDKGDPGDPLVSESGETPDEASKWSPDRLDAFVYGVTDFLIGQGGATGKVEVADGRIPKTQAERGTAAPKPLAGQIPQPVRQRQIVERQLGDGKDGSAGA